MFKTILLTLLAGIIFLGLGTIPVRLDCIPRVVSGTAVVTPRVDCRYQSSRIWGLLPNASGEVLGVSGLERHSRVDAQNYSHWALRLRAEQRAIEVTPYAGDVIDSTVSDDFETLLRTSTPFIYRTVLVDRLIVLSGYFFLGLSLVFVGGFPWTFARQIDRTVSDAPRLETSHWWRIGRDDSFIPLGIFGVPVWFGFAVLYLIGCFAFLMLADWLPPNASNHFAASGPALLGLIDLIRRMRTIEYFVSTPFGLEVTHHASLVDRLTFRECGWYLPILFAPIPLWLLGGGITATILTM